MPSKLFDSRSVEIENELKKIAKKELNKKFKVTHYEQYPKKFSKKTVDEWEKFTKQKFDANKEYLRYYNYKTGEKIRFRDLTSKKRVKNSVEPIWNEYVKPSKYQLNKIDPSKRDFYSAGRSIRWDYTKEEHLAIIHNHPSGKALFSDANIQMMIKKDFIKYFSATSPDSTFILERMKNIPSSHKRILKDKIKEIYKEGKIYIERIKSGISEPNDSLFNKYDKQIEEDITKLFNEDKYINIYKITRP
ncbi:MAG: hypothetical protein FWH29_05060 [Methanobrevibacter sp.]|nr:hypothetical protein [Methanobrevibacter sp.]